MAASNEYQENNQKSSEIYTKVTSINFLAGIHMGGAISDLYSLYVKAHNINSAFEGYTYRDVAELIFGVTDAKQIKYIIVETMYIDLQFEAD